MNASLYQANELSQPRPSIAQLYMVIKQVYEWKNDYKSELRSIDLSSSENHEVLSQLMQEHQILYQEQQTKLGNLIGDLLQKYDPYQVFSLLSGHHLCEEQLKSLERATVKSEMTGFVKADFHPSLESSSQQPPIQKMSSPKKEELNHSNLVGEKQAQAELIVQPIVELPKDFSIGKAVWKPSQTQLKRLHQPQQHKKNSSYLRSIKVKTYAFKSAELALNHLAGLLEQEYSDEKFSEELEIVLKNSPLDKRDPRLCELLVGIDLPLGKVFKALRRAVRDYQTQIEADAYEELSSPAEDAWDFAHHFAGKRIELLGGNPRPETVSRLQKALPNAHIHWTHAEGKSGDKIVGSLERKAQSGSIDVILLITSFMGHSVSRPFIPLNRLKLDESGRRLNVRLVRGGYGLSTLKAELMNCID